MRGVKIVGSFLRSLAAPGDRRGYAILLVGWLLAFALCARPEPGHNLLSRADGTWMYLQMRSHIVDRDVDYTNDYSYAGSHPNGTPYWVRWFPRSSLGKPVNPWTMGTGVLLSPFFLLAIGSCKIANLFGADIPSHGVTLPHQYITYLGTVVYGLWGFVLVHKISRRRFGRLAAWTGGLAVLVTSPVFFYTTYAPSYSHGFAFFTAASLLWCWDDLLDYRQDGGAYSDEPPRWWRWAIFGAVVGLAALVRPQLVIFALPAGVRWIQLVWWQRKSPRALMRLALGVLTAALTAVLVFLPQMLLWKSIYGTAVVVPQGEHFMAWNSSLMWETLFSDRSGLFTITPAMWLAGLGIVLALRHHRTLALASLALLLLMAFVNGAAWDYWGGWTYGARRFSSIVTVLMIGGASLVFSVRAYASAHPRVAGWLAAACIFAPFFLFGQWSMRQQVLDYGFTSEVADRDITYYAKRFVDDMHAAVGNPFNYPHSLVMRAGYGVPLGAYTRIVTDYPLDRPPKEMRSVRLDLTTPRWQKLVARGAKLETRGNQQIWKVQDECVGLFLALRLKHGYELSIESADATQFDQLRLELNGERVAAVNASSSDPQSLEFTVRSVRFVLPKAAVKPGLNRLELCGLEEGAGLREVALAYR